MGRVSATSSRPLSDGGSFAIQWAEKIPRKNTAAVEMAAIRRELKRGYQSKSVTSGQMSEIRAGQAALPCGKFSL